MKTFKVEVGDLFDAGHHILKSVLVKSEKDVSEIRKAFVASAKEMGFFDEKENIFALEINVNPCISPDSGFYAACEKYGWDYTKMVEIIISNT